MTARVLQDGFLRFPDLDLAAWCRRYRVEPFEAECSRCGHVLRANVPFAYRAFRGLSANPCECGNHAVPFVVAGIEEPSHDEGPRPKRKRSRKPAKIIPLRRW